MMYTLGYEPNYDKLIERVNAGETVFKTGRGPSYGGGSVWRTANEVWDWIDENQPRLENYAVYELEGDFETDTAPTKVGPYPWRDLLVDRPLVRKVPRSGVE